MVDLYITLFSGFMQRSYSEANGFVSLENEVHKLANLPNVRVRLLPWNANVSDAAETAWRLRPKTHKQLHIVACYSYGGQAAADYCRELAARGQCRAIVLCCDPVKRSRYWRDFYAATGIGAIRFPESVTERVTVYRQRNPRWSIERAWKRGFSKLFQPAGHDVYLGRRRIPPVWVGDEHQYIDNNNNFHTAVLNLTKNHVQWAKGCLS